MMLSDTAATAAKPSSSVAGVRFAPTSRVRVIPARTTASATPIDEAAWPLTGDADTTTKLRDGPCPIGMLLDAWLRAYFHRSGPTASVERLMQLLGSKRCAVIARENAAMADACWNLYRSLEAAAVAASLVDLGGTGGAGHVRLRAWGWGAAARNVAEP